MQERGFDKVGLHFVYNPYEIASGAYERTIAHKIAKRGIKTRIKIFTQGCAGLADAVEAGDPRAGEMAVENFRALMSKHSADRDAGPMKAIILGCTHYPFVLASLEREAKDMVFVDPALATAELWYLDLLEKKILSDRGRMKLSAYISVPAKGLDGKYLDGNGSLTRACKYGRDENDCTVWTDVRPYDAGLAIGNAFIRQSLGAVWRLLCN